MKTARKKICPICGKPIDWENNPHRPFCSARCKTIDLGGWASDRYRIPEKKENDESGE